MIFFLPKTCPGTFLQVSILPRWPGGNSGISPAFQGWFFKVILENMLQTVIYRHQRVCFLRFSAISINIIYFYGRLMMKYFISSWKSRDWQPHWNGYRTETLSSRILKVLRLCLFL